MVKGGENQPSRNTTAPLRLSNQKKRPQIIPQIIRPAGGTLRTRLSSFKDVHTLIDVMKNKATGELQDDKTYLMEHTIQVSHRVLVAYGIAHGVLACQWVAHKVKNPSRLDQRFHR